MSASAFVITIRSEKHHDQLSSRLWNHFRAKRNVDCDLNYRGRTIKLHKLLLDVLLQPDDQSALSSNAEQLLERDCLDMMVEFLYLGTVDVRESQLKGLLKLATESNFRMLVDAIQEAIKHERDKKMRLVKAEQMTPETEGVVTNKGHAHGQAQLQSGTQHSTTNSEAKATNKPIVDDHPLGRGNLLAGSQGHLKLGMRVPVANSSQNSTKKSISSSQTNKSVEKTSARVSDNSLTKQTVDAGTRKFPVESDHQLREPVGPDESLCVLNDDLDMDVDVATDTADQSTYKCNVCQKLFAFDEDYQHHVMSHQIELGDDNNSNGNNERSVNASSCSENHESNSNVNADVSHVDDNRKQNVEIFPILPGPAKLFYCRMCRTFYSSKDAMAAHKNSEHNPKIPRSYPCELCGKIYTRKSGLVRHRKVIHEKRVYMCDQCPKTLCSRTKLRDHKHLHSSEKPFKCELCQASFSAKISLRHHKNVKHLGQCAICDICGCKFNDNGHLKKHIATRHSDTKDHKCKLCPKAYTNIDSLKAHMISHGEKRHACDYCDKTFFLKGSLNYHLKTHAKNGIPSAEPKIKTRTRR